MKELKTKISEMCNISSKLLEDIVNIQQYLSDEDNIDKDLYGTMYGALSGMAGVNTLLFSANMTLTPKEDQEKAIKDFMDNIPGLTEAIEKNKGDDANEN